jgi:hypothetical protein
MKWQLMGCRLLVMASLPTSSMY